MKGVRALYVDLGVEPLQPSQTCRAVVYADPKDTSGLTRIYTQAELDAAVAAERERCAKLCDGIARQYKDSGHGHAAERAANAIRHTPDTP